MALIDEYANHERSPVGQRQPVVAEAPRYDRPQVRATSDYGPTMEAISDGVGTLASAASAFYNASVYGAQAKMLNRNKRDAVKLASMQLGDLQRRQGEAVGETLQDFAAGGARVDVGDPQKAVRDIQAIIAEDVRATHSNLAKDLYAIDIKQRELRQRQKMAQLGGILSIAEGGFRAASAGMGG